MHDAPAVEHGQRQQMQENMFGVSFEKKFCHSHVYGDRMRNITGTFDRWVSDEVSGLIGQKQKKTNFSLAFD